MRSYWITQGKKEGTVHLLDININFKNASQYTLGAEKAMTTHSSTLAWKIPWAEEPGRLQSMGSRRVGHD